MTLPVTLPPLGQLSSLPDELILESLKWTPKSLGRFARVCKRANELSQDLGLWKAIFQLERIPLPRRPLSFAAFRLAYVNASANAYLQSLWQKENTLTEGMIQETGKKYPATTSLTVYPRFNTTVSVSNNFLTVIANSFQNLESFSEHLRKPLAKRLADNEISKFSELSSKLKSLHLTQNSLELSEEGFKALFTNCNKLESVTLSPTYWLNSNTIELLKIPTLRQIDIRSRASGLLTRATLQAIAISAHAFTSISVTVTALPNEYPFNEEDVVEVLTKKPGLTSFGISGVTAITEKTFAAIAAHSPKIQSLYLSGQITLSIAHLTELKELECISVVDNTDDRTEAHQKAIAAAFNNGKLQKLEDINGEEPPRRAKAQGRAV